MEMKPGYKQTELGVIPEDWEIKSIAQIAPLQRGFDLLTTKVNAGSIPVVYSNGVMNYHDTAMAHGPGVVTGRSGTLGKVHYIEEDYWPHNTSLWVTRFNGNSPKFIYYLYTYIGFERFASGSGVPTLNRNDAHEFQAPIPSTFNEQAAIAAALTDADALIKSLEQLLAKKRQIKQGAMQELLTGKKRLPTFENKLGYKRTEVGLIPDDWKASTLRELCSFENGDRGKNYPSRTSYASDGVPFINAGHVDDGRIMSSNLNYIPKKSFDILRGGKVVPGDILFCLRGSLGKFGIVRSDFGEGAIASSLVIVRSKSTRLKREYLNWYFRSAYCAQMIDKWSGGAAQPNLGAQDLAQFIIPIPPTTEEQTAIVEILNNMDAEITSLEEKLTKAFQIKQGMMQELLTGRIRLI
jgi:type I restriction enzyme S subunit